MPKRPEKPLPPDAPCPCGSGKPYKDCCAGKGFEWVVDEEDEIYRNVPLPPELAGILEDIRDDFVAEHGREPAPDDPLFSDLPHAEHLEADLAEALRAAGLPPELVYAFEKTGLLLTEENRHLIPDKDVEAWRRSVEEFRALGGDPWAQEDRPISEDEPRLGTDGAAERPLPTGEGPWLSEIAWAYRDALEAKPLGVFTTGKPLADEDLFHLAPHVFLKVRGGDFSGEERDEIVEGTLASYVAAMDDDGLSRFVAGSPILAFAFCYLVAHGVAELLEESEVLEIFDACLTEETKLEDLVRGD